MERITEKIISCILNIDGYISTDALADLLKISTSNIKHNLPLIKKELEKYNVQLLSAPKKGICMVATKEQRDIILHAIREEVSKNSEFYTHRKEYILETLYLFNTNYTVQLFAEELSVSKNTIMKDITRINSELKKYDIQIIKVRNQGVSFEGYEFNIRQSMIETFNSKYWNWSSGIIVDKTGEADLRVSKKAYTYLSNTYSIKGMLKIQKLIQDAEKALKVDFTDVSFCRLLEYVEIMKQRINIEKSIKYDFTVDSGITIESKYMDAAYDIVKALFSDKLKAKSLKLETKFLAARLYVATKCTECDDEYNEEYVMVAKEYLKDTEYILETGIIGNNEELAISLSRFFRMLKVREVFRVLDWNDLYSDIREKSSNIYIACVANVYKVQRKLQIHFQQDDIAWMTLLVENCIKNKDNKLPVVFVHATNERIAQFQKRLIENKISEIFVEKVIHYKDFEFNQDSDRIIISTVPFKCRRKNLVEVTKHINEGDIEQIKDFIQTSYEVRKGSEIETVVKEVFEKNLIAINLSASTKEEVIKNMSGTLLEAGYVNEGFEEKILAAEKKCSTAIGNSIALPHMYYEEVNSNKIAIAKLKYPVEWDNSEKVSLVFMIAIRYEDAKKVNALFRYLYRMIDDRELMQRLKEATSNEQIFNLLMNFVI